MNQRVANVAKGAKEKLEGALEPKKKVVGGKSLNEMADYAKKKQRAAASYD